VVLEYPLYQQRTRHHEAKAELGLVLPSLTLPSSATAAQFRVLGEAWCSRHCGGEKISYVLDQQYADLEWAILEGRDASIASALQESKIFDLSLVTFTQSAGGHELHTHKWKVHPLLPLPTEAACKALGTLQLNIGEGVQGADVLTQSVSQTAIVAWPHHHRIPVFGAAIGVHLVLDAFDGDEHALAGFKDVSELQSKVVELQSKCVEPLAHSWRGLASFELLLAMVSGDRTAAQSSFTEFLEEVFAQWQRTAEDKDEDEDWELQMREAVALILKALLYFGTDTAVGVALKDALADNAATSEHGAQVVMQILQCYCNSDLTAACGGNVFLQSLVRKIIASLDSCIQPQEARAGSCYEDAKQIEMVEALISATRLPSEEMLEKVCLSIVSNQARFDPQRVLGPLLYKVLHPPLSPAPASYLPYDTALRKSRMKMC